MSTKPRRRPRRFHERWLPATGLDRWLFCDGCGRIVYEDQPVRRHGLAGQGGALIFVGHEQCIIDLERGIDRLPLAIPPEDGTPERTRSGRPESA